MSDSPSAIITLERLCRILGVEDPDDWLDKYYDFADDDERDDAYIRYSRAIEAVGERALEEHGMMLEPQNSGREFELKPAHDWRSAAQRVMETVNGKGPFYFPNVEEFAEINCGSLRDAAISHLGYVKHYPAVYGGPSIQAQIERHMR